MKGYTLYVKPQFEILETKRSSSECHGFQTVVSLDQYMGSFNAEVVFFTDPTFYLNGTPQSTVR